MPPTPNNATHYNCKIAQPPCERTRNFSSGLSHFISVLWSNVLRGLQQHAAGGRKQAALAKVPETGRPPRLSEQPGDYDHGTPFIGDQGAGLGTVLACRRMSVPAKLTECLGHLMDVPVGRGELGEKYRVRALDESRAQSNGEGLAVGFHQDRRHANGTQVRLRCDELPR